MPFTLQPEDGFMKAETCSFYVLLIKYILCNKFVFPTYSQAFGVETIQCVLS